MPAAFPTKQLEHRLRRAIRGEVRFDNGSRALYSTDSSNYRQIPIGVVIPRTEADVVETVVICRELGVPITSRGGGTSLAGQCCNVAVIIDFSKYLNHIIQADPGRKIARVEPGVIYDDVNRAVAKYKLAFAPDPSTHNHCTIGGMIGNNSCGVHSVMAAFAGTGARTSDNIERLKILTYDGTQLEVGPTSDIEIERIIREGGRPGQIYSGLKSLRDRYTNLIQKRYPKIFSQTPFFSILSKQFAGIAPKRSLPLSRSKLLNDGSLEGKSACMSVPV